MQKNFKGRGKEEVLTTWLDIFCEFSSFPFTQAVVLLGIVPHPSCPFLTIFYCSVYLGHLFAANHINKSPHKKLLTNIIGNGSLANYSFPVISISYLSFCQDVQMAERIPLCLSDCKKGL